MSLSVIENMFFLTKFYIYHKMVLDISYLKKSYRTHIYKPFEHINTVVFSGSIIYIIYRKTNNCITTWYGIYKQRNKWGKLQIAPPSFIYLRFEHWGRVYFWDAIPYPSRPGKTVGRDEWLRSIINGLGIKHDLLLNSASRTQGSSLNV